MSNSQPGGIGTKFLLVSTAIIVILAGLKAAQSLVAPFLLAVFFALILTPPLRWLKKKGLSDSIAILVLSTLVFMLGLGIVLVFSNSLNHFAAKLPNYQKKVTAGYAAIDSWINNIADKVHAFGESISPLNPMEFGNEESPHPSPLPEGEGTLDNPLPEGTGMLNNLLPEGQRTLDSPLPKREGRMLAPDNPPVRERLSLSNVIQVNTLISSVRTGVNTLLNIATVSMLVLVMLVFMLMEAARMPDKVREAFGSRDLSSEYFKKIADDTWNYMKIKTIICFLTGTATFLGLWFLGVEYALLWGLLMFFLNYIPSIGQVIASVPPILLALIDGGLISATLVTAWLIFVNTLFGIGVEPRYLEHGLGISSLVVLLSLIFWGWLLGPIGMFLSAPLTMVVKIVLQNDQKTRWLAVLLSNR